MSPRRTVHRKQHTVTCSWPHIRAEKQRDFDQGRIRHHRRAWTWRTLEKSPGDRKGSWVSLSSARQLAVEGALHPERLPPPLNFGLKSSLVELPRRDPRVTTHLKGPSKEGTPIHPPRSRLGESASRVSRVRLLHPQKFPEHKNSRTFGMHFIEWSADSNN